MRRSARCGAREAIAPGQMSIARGVPTIRVSSGTRPPGGRGARPGGRAGSAPRRDLPRLLEVPVVVDFDPRDGPDRRDANVPASVGVLLEAVLVVELRV